MVSASRYLEFSVWEGQGWGLGFRVWGLGFKVLGLGFRVRVWGLGFKVHLGFGRTLNSHPQTPNLESSTPNPSPNTQRPIKR